MTLSDTAHQSVDEGAVRDADWVPPVFADAEAALPDVAEPDLELEAERARQQGYDAGFAEGQAAARAQAAGIVAEVNSLLEALSKPFLDTDSALTKDLLELTTQVAEAVLRRELASDAGTLQKVIEEALAVLAESAGKIEVLIHPDDALLCRELGLIEEEHIVLRESPHLRRGGVELRCGSMLVDATVSTRLRAVLSALYADAGLPVPLEDAEPDVSGDC